MSYPHYDVASGSFSNLGNIVQSGYMSFPILSGSGAINSGDVHAISILQGFIASGGLPASYYKTTPGPVEIWIRQQTPLAMNTPNEIVADWCEDQGWTPMANYLRGLPNGR